MKRKRIIISAILVAILCGAWYGYSEYTRKVKDLSGVKPGVRITAEELIGSFERSEAAANGQYLDQVIAVQGFIRKVERDDKGYYAVILGPENSRSSVRCSMDSVHHSDVKDLSPATVVTIKGACTGFTADELIGSDVILNRCVVERSNK